MSGADGTRARCHPRLRPRRRAREHDGADGPVGLRQDHAVAHRRRPRRPLHRRVSASHPDTRIGLMFQEPRLLPWRTVKQNIELVAAPDFTEQDLERLAQAVGIADMLPRYPQELSLGLGAPRGARPRLRHQARPAPARRAVRVARRAHRRPAEAAVARGLAGTADHGHSRHPQCARGDHARRPAGAARAAAHPCGRRSRPSTCRKPSAITKWSRRSTPICCAATPANFSGS